MSKPGKIEPALFRHPAFIELPMDSRLCYIGLRLLGGKEAAVEMPNKVIKAALFPADDLSVHELIVPLINGGLITMSKKDTVINITPLELERTTRAARKPAAVAADPAAPKAADPVVEVMDHWRATFGKPKAVLDDKRRRRILLALAMGYKVEHLQQCITGYSKSPFHMGENDRQQKYTDIELFLRDAQHIDKGLEFFDIYGKAPSLGPTPGAGFGQRKQGTSPEAPWDSGVRSNRTPGA